MTEVLGAISFLTPFGRARRPSGRTLDWFPVVGVAMGALLGGIRWLTSRAWAAPVAAAIVVAVDLGITGLLHFDGLVDSADGLLAPMDRARRLAVMAAPEVGAFGIGVAVVVLLLRWAALTELRASVLLLMGIWCLSRTAMAVVARTQPYARNEGGLASAFIGQPRWIPLVVGGAASVGLVCAWRAGPGVAVAAGGGVAAIAVVALARRRIGGYTGDVLGALGVVAETVSLIVAAAKW